MSRSAIYVVNATQQLNVPVNTPLNLGSVQRRFGCDFELSGTDLKIFNPGYYEINVNADVAPGQVGDVSLILYKDNVPVLGAKATETAAAANDILNLSFHVVVREGCRCCDGPSIYTLEVVGVDEGVTTATVTNIGTVAQRL